MLAREESNICLQQLPRWVRLDVKYNDLDPARQLTWTMRAIELHRTWEVFADVKEGER